MDLLIVLVPKLLLYDLAYRSGGLVPRIPDLRPLDALLFRLFSGVLWLHLAFDPLRDVGWWFLDVIAELFELSDHISQGKFK